MGQPFIVSGSVRLRDVSRPAKGETPETRLHRLAAKAQVEGCRVYRQHGADSRFLVTSARDESLVYMVDVRDARCGCEGFARWGACKHFALVLAELGELPDPEPPTSTPAVVRPWQPFVLDQAEKLLASLIERQERGEGVPAAEFDEAVAAVAFYTEEAARAASNAPKVVALRPAANDVVAAA